MIVVTRLNGPPFAVNPDLLERVEATPDTILTLIDGSKFLVQESVTDIVALVRDYRASVVATARDLGGSDPRREAPAEPEAPEGRPHLTAVPPLPSQHDQHDQHDRLPSGSTAHNPTDPTDLITAEED